MAHSATTAGGEQPQLPEREDQRGMASATGTAPPEPDVLRSPFLPPIITTSQGHLEEASTSTSSGARRVEFALRKDDHDDFELPMPPSQPILGVGNIEAIRRGSPYFIAGRSGRGTSTASSSFPTSATGAQSRVNGPVSGAVVNDLAKGAAGGALRAAKDVNLTDATFRGYSWRVCQEVMSDVKAHGAVLQSTKSSTPGAASPALTDEDKSLSNVVRVFVRMEECCLGREDYKPHDKHLVWPELQHQRRIVGVWQALHNLGLMQVCWYRWANLVLVVVRALFNSSSITYNFTRWQPSQSTFRPQYRALVAVVVWFELLITLFWLLYLVFAAGSLAWNYKQYTESGRKAKRAVRVAAHTVGLVKAVQRLGTFSAMRGAKHAISIMRIVRWYKRIYQELRFKGNYMMHHLLTLSPRSLGGVINRWWSTASTVVSRSGRPEPESWGPFQAQLHNLPQNATPVATPEPAPTGSGSLFFLSSRFKSIRLSGQMSTEGMRRAVLKLPHYCASCVAAMPQVLVSFLTSLLLACVLVAMATWPLWGLAAFFIKLAQLKFVSQKFIGSWSSSEVLLFLAFMNQLAALESSEQYRLEGKLQLLFWGSDAQFSEEEKDAEHCFQQSIILDAWLQPEGSLVAAAAKLLWLGPDDINAAFIRDWEVRKANSWLP